MPGGTIVTLFSILVTLFLDLRSELYGYNLFTLSFVMTASIGYGFTRIKNRLHQLCSLRSEKLDDSVTVLSNNIRGKNKNIYALEEKLTRYLLLKEVAESMSTALSLDEINSIIVEKTYRTIGKGGRLLLFLVDVEKQELMLSVSRDNLKVKNKRGDAFDQWVLRHRKSLIIEDVEKDFRFPADHTKESKALFRSLIVTPMISEDKVIGILRMDSAHELMYTQDDLRLLDIIANLGAVAVQNALLYSKTQELAIRDGLTGLMVRRFFMEALHQELHRSAMNRKELSLLMLDIDHFKDYNDKYGHTAGDIVLKHLARTLSSMAQEGDVVARYGGEELVVVLSGRDKVQALAEAEKIRKFLKENPIKLRRQETSITVSIGVANYPEDAVLEEELIRVADACLYKAKAEGRDRVCSK